MNAWTVTAALSAAVFAVGLFVATHWMIAYLLLMAGVIAVVGVYGATAKLQGSKWHVVIETADSDGSS